MTMSETSHSAPPVLALETISKAFPGVRALNDVSLSVHAGQVHALIGENGAGKSTLLKILSGIYHADTGTILIDGKKVELSSPKAARLAGIAMIHQELQQVPELDVAQNMFLGAPLTKFGLFTSKRIMREKAREALKLLDPSINPAAKIRDLRVAQWMSRRRA
jgi:ribose transport system ATP-binding protein